MPSTSQTVALVVIIVLIVIGVVYLISPTTLTDLFSKGSSTTTGTGSSSSSSSTAVVPTGTQTGTSSAFLAANYITGFTSALTYPPYSSSTTTSTNTTTAPVASIHASWAAFPGAQGYNATLVFVANASNNVSQIVYTPNVTFNNVPLGAAYTITVLPEENIGVIGTVVNGVAPSLTQYAQTYTSAPILVAAIVSPALPNSVSHIVVTNVTYISATLSWVAVPNATLGYIITATPVATASTNTFTASGTGTQVPTVSTSTNTGATGANIVTMQFEYPSWAESVSTDPDKSFQYVANPYGTYTGTTTGTTTSTATSTSTSVTPVYTQLITNLTPNISYSFSIVAVNSAGHSAVPTTCNALLSGIPLPVPANVKADINGATIQVSMSVPSGLPYGNVPGEPFFDLTWSITYTNGDTEIDSENGLDNTILYALSNPVGVMYAYTIPIEIGAGTAVVQVRLRSLYSVGPYSILHITLPGMSATATATSTATQFDITNTSTTTSTNFIYPS